MTEAAAISISDLHKRFADIEVLRGVSLAAQQGDVVSILGSSRSGKSTLLRRINLLETPTSGEISVYGETLKLAKNKHGEMEPQDQQQINRLVRDERGSSRS